MLNWNTYSPALLVLYCPLSGLKYSTQRLLYFLLDWVCVAGLFWLTRSWFNRASQGLHAALFALFAITDFALVLHMERGQYYLEIAVVVAAAITLWRTHPGQPGWIGPLGLSCLLLIRPTFLILLPVLWLQGFRQHVRRTLAISCGIGLTLLIAFGLQPWRAYFATVRQIQQRYVESLFLPEQSGPVQLSERTASAAYRQVEGEDFSQSLSSLYVTSRSFLSICMTGKHTRSIVTKVFPNAKLLYRVNSALLLLSAGYCLLIAHLLRSASTDIKLGFAFFTPIVVESFAPQRNAYCDVMLIPILLLGSAVLAQKVDWKDVRFRAFAFFVVAVCAISALGPRLPLLAGRPLMALSLARFAVLFLCVNILFAAAACRATRVFAHDEEGTRQIRI
ncbi:MAG: hypothetical protein ACP5FH_09155 [Terracidiphilus sp.]